MLNKASLGVWFNQSLKFSKMPEEMVRKEKYVFNSLKKINFEEITFHTRKCLFYTLALSSISYAFPVIYNKSKVYRDKFSS